MSRLDNLSNPSVIDLSNSQLQQVTGGKKFRECIPNLIGGVLIGSASFTAFGAAFGGATSLSMCMSTNYVH